MDNLTLASHLIWSAVKEQNDLEVYNKWCDRLRETNASWSEYQKLSEAFPHPPTKTSINDKIKVARKLLAAAYIK